MRGTERNVIYGRTFDLVLEVFTSEQGDCCKFHLYERATAKGNRGLTRRLVGTGLEMIGDELFEAAMKRSQTTCWRRRVGHRRTPRTRMAMLYFTLLPNSCHEKSAVVVAQGGWPRRVRQRTMNTAAFGNTLCSDTRFGHVTATLALLAAGAGCQVSASVGGGL